MDQNTTFSRETREYTVDQLRVLSIRIADANNAGAGAGYGVNLNGVRACLSVDSETARRLDMMAAEMAAEAGQLRRFALGMARGLAAAADARDANPGWLQVAA